MTHQVQTTALDEIGELLAEQGFDGLADALRVLLNEVMKLERAAVLGPAPTSGLRAEPATPTASSRMALSVLQAPSGSKLVPCRGLRHAGAEGFEPRKEGPRCTTGSLPPSDSSAMTSPGNSTGPPSSRPAAPPATAGAAACSTPSPSSTWLLTQVVNGNTALDTSAPAGRPDPHRVGLLPGPLAPAPGRPPGGPPPRRRRTRPEVDATGLWHGHRTFLVDGSSFSMPDTPELRRPLRPLGDGPPRLRLPHGAAHGPLPRRHRPADRGVAVPHPGHDIAWASGLHPRLGAGGRPGRRPRLLLVRPPGSAGPGGPPCGRPDAPDAGRRLHAEPAPRRARRQAGRRGRPRTRWVRSLGPTDQVVEWFRPPDVPSWLGAEAFAALPASLLIRELRYRAERPGFRTREVTLATTLRDGETYPASELAGLYAGRWAIELNLRHLKTTMKMDVLRCKTRGGCDQGVDGLLPGLQSGQGGDAGGGSPAGYRGRPDQLRRRSAMAGLCPGGRAATGVGGQPAPARPVRAEGDQEAAQALRVADRATSSDAQTTAGPVR